MACQRWRVVEWAPGNDDIVGRFLSARLARSDFGAHELRRAAIINAAARRARKQQRGDKRHGRHSPAS